ncbi:LicD family protein [Clostridium perfringens]|nr:LicD family protein [Clostridium perfringens]
MNNLKKVNIRELQLKEFEILCEIDRICKKHNIKYFLSWGTAIGAVRHKGFIPWDDDTDISMLWDDYIKFEEVCKSELGNKFFFQTNKQKSDYWMPFNKIILNNTSFMLKKCKHMDLHWGICVDIFPIIAIPNDEKEARKQRFFVDIYNKLVTRPFVKKNDIGKKISTAKIYFTLVPRGINEFFKKICIKNITKYDINESNKVAEFLSLDSSDRIIFDKEIFLKQVFVDFENKKFPIAIGYDKYLSQCYGDYMILPDEKDRVGHVGSIIDLNNSYEKYK